MTNQERIDTLTEAQEKLFEAIELIEAAVKGTGREAYADAYTLAHLKIMAFSGHGYLSRDTNLDDMMEWYRGDDGDDEDYED